jgi:hypothetical protein
MKDHPLTIYQIKLHQNFPLDNRENQQILIWKMLTETAKTPQFLNIECFYPNVADITIFSEKNKYLNSN